MGGRFGSYELLEVLGKGGMGTVHRARSAAGQIVALKLINADVSSDSVFRRRFAREASSAAKVSSPHVVAVVDVGEHEGIPYLATAYLPGGSLDDRIRREGRLSLATVVEVCQQVGSGLDAIHREGIFHRDLKPANIVLDEDGRACITDFGVAKDVAASILTLAGATMGTSDYMAPEQISGMPVSAAADVYSLGCVVFECLTGRPPFAHLSGTRLLYAHLADAPPDPCAARAGLPGEVGWAVLRALEKEPARRPPTGTAFARMVQIGACAGDG
ncbi:MAG TPA: serine/threonine-protein kinase [Solirubrobacteraceae bacterium]|jgi:serine/threonine-protein kinase